jgi:hypothetical protein
MRRPDRAYVRGRVHGLLWMGGRHSAPVPTPPEQLPAGSTARLAVMWAQTQKPDLFKGQLDRLMPERRAEAISLMELGIEAWPELDLSDDLELPVRCGRYRHTIRLCADGTLEALSHPGVDVESERVAASLGGDLPPCITEIDAAFAAHPAPHHDLKRRPDPISAGQLLWFVRLCRSWLDHGYDVISAGEALEAGVWHSTVMPHLSCGLSISAALDWREVTPQEAAEWSELGFSPQDREVWLEQGRTLEEAALAGGSSMLTRWARVAGARIPSPLLGEWAAFGPPSGVWGEAAARGMHPDTVRQWTDVGFRPLDVLRYAHLQVPLAEALLWREAGFSAFQACGYLGVGMSLEEAFVLRAYPSRQVQELWPRLRSPERIADMLKALVS